MAELTKDHVHVCYIFTTDIEMFVCTILVDDPIGALRSYHSVPTDR